MSQLKINNANRYLSTLDHNAPNMLHIARRRGNLSIEDYSIILTEANRGWVISNKPKKLKKSKQEVKDLKAIKDELRRVIDEIDSAFSQTVHEQVVLAFILDIIINISEYFYQPSIYKHFMYREAMNQGIGNKAVQCLWELETLRNNMLVTYQKKVEEVQDPVYPEEVYKPLLEGCKRLSNVVLKYEFFLSYVNRLHLNQDTLEVCDNMDIKIAHLGEFSGYSLKEFEERRKADSEVLKDDYEFFYILHNRGEVIRSYLEDITFKEEDIKEIEDCITLIFQGLRSLGEILYI